MRLTPADVHNVAFKKPSIGKRGYDEDEVDAFLDLVEAELSRLIEENNELTQRVSTYEAGGTPPTADTQPLHDEIGRLAQENQTLAQRAEAAESGIAQAQADAEAARQAQAEAAQQLAAAANLPAPEQAAAPAVRATDHHVAAARLLGLAQETADRLTDEASAEAEDVKNSARAESESLLSNARNESERLVTDAKNRADTMVAEATATAESTERDSKIKAEAMDREAQRKYTDTMTQLTEQRTGLERKIDDLRTYEREYRSRLKGWITEQLAQLDAADSSGEQQEVAPEAEQEVVPAQG